jgi:outer membrane autotransporter protein
MQGVTLQYEFDILTEANALLARVASGGINPQTKALAEGYLAGMTLLNGGADLAAQGIPLAADAARRASGPQGFGVVSGGRQRYRTGSHIDVDGRHLLAGFASANELGSGHATVGAFFEHGRGDYDTHNSFATAARVKGQGDTDYSGAGLLGRFDFAGSARGYTYAEATLRAGRVKTDFHSSDLRDANGVRASYKSKAAYYGASIGLGQLLPINDKASLDLYGKALWTHENGDTVRLSTGDPVKFADVDSQRLRLGAKYRRALGDDPAFSAYAGLAWEYEFDGKAKAKTNGYKIDAPKLKGGSGVLELGLTLTPTPTKPLTLDLGLQGYAGQREGVTGSLRVNYKF